MLETVGMSSIEGGNESLYGRQLKVSDNLILCRGCCWAKSVLGSEDLVDSNRREETKSGDTVNPGGVRSGGRREFNLGSALGKAVIEPCGLAMNLRDGGVAPDN
ncbi:hypothetical protein L2E82_49522 [Cichorium intybus]|uniref:Uncharacterized protein n=1 Tax=Cichorium intybus TaxID=13427 RepID=A0ACB8Z0V0_CICIN|nr:hypothetical protein L2E82_49522 [Cichorium intybus]